MLRRDDHLVGPREQGRRHVEAERLGRLDVDHKLELRRGLYWKVGWLLALEMRSHSITSSARASTVGGISRPSAFAAVKLIISCNFVGNSIGKSAGLAPLKILSTNVAVRRQLSRKFV